MAKKNLNETLSNETEEVQNGLLEEILDNSKNDIQEPTENNQVDIQDNKEQKEIIHIGSRVKVKPDLSNDVIGRRIHAGLKNYVYTVKAVRPDDYVTIECMTYNFTVAKSDVILL